MTVPFERTSAVKRTRQFLYDLLDPKKTPKVPKKIRAEAYRLLKHYPSEYYLDEAAKGAPHVWGSPVYEDNG